MGERPAIRIVSGPETVGGCRLHTATLSLVETDGSVFELFHACRVVTPNEVVARLAARYGASVAGAATVRVGVDPAHPIVASLIGVEAAPGAADGDGRPDAG